MCHTDLFFSILASENHSPYILLPLPNLSQVHLALHHRMPQYLDDEAALVCMLPSKSLQPEKEVNKKEVPLLNGLVQETAQNSALFLLTMDRVKNISKKKHRS